MDEQKETKLTEPTPEQVGAFMAVLTKALSAQVEQQNKFEAIYANNFQFEPSAWDLKVLFGQLEQHTGRSVVDWHTAITIPWLQVKFVAYYLRLQAAWYEHQNAPLSAPSFVIPPHPKPPTIKLPHNP